MSRLNSVQVFRKVPEFFREVRQEVMRVTWPTRKELTLTTSMVFLMVFVVALFFFVVDEALDRGIIDALARKDGEALQSLPRKKLNSGSSEIRMWISIGGAVEHLDMAWSHYVPGYRTPAGSGTGLGFAYWS